MFNKITFTFLLIEFITTIIIYKITFVLLPFILIIALNKITFNTIIGISPILLIILIILLKSQIILLEYYFKINCNITKIIINYLTTITINLWLFGFSFLAKHLKANYVLGGGIFTLNLKSTQLIPNELNSLLTYEKLLRNNKLTALERNELYKNYCEAFAKVHTHKPALGKILARQDPSLVFSKQNMLPVFSKQTETSCVLVNALDRDYVLSTEDLINLSSPAIIKLTNTMDAFQNTNQSLPKLFSENFTDSFPFKKTVVEKGTLYAKETIASCTINTELELNASYEYAVNNPLLKKQTLDSKLQIVKSQQEPYDTMVVFNKTNLSTAHPKDVGVLEGIQVKSLDRIDITSTEALTKHVIRIINEQKESFNNHKFNKDLPFTLLFDTRSCPYSSVIKVQNVLEPLLFYYKLEHPWMNITYVLPKVNNADSWIEAGSLLSKDLI